MAKKKRKDSGARYTDIVKQKALRMAKRDVSVPEIARKLGPSEKTIRTWLRDAGISAPGRARRYDRKQILKELLAKDRKGNPKHTRADICSRHGCSRKFLSELATGKIAA